MAIYYQSLSGLLAGGPDARVQLEASNWLTEPGSELFPPAPQTAYCSATTDACGNPAGTFSLPLMSTDSSPTPSGWYWTVTISGIPSVPFETFSFYLPAAPYSFTATDASPCVFTAPGSSYGDGDAVALTGDSLPAGFTEGTTYYVTGADGASFSLAATSGGPAIDSASTGSGTAYTAVTDISSVAQLSPVPDVETYLPLPSGTATEGYVPTATGTGNATEWAPSGEGGSGYPSEPVVSGTASAGDVLTASSSTEASWQAPASGSGTVTSVAVESANGFAGTVADDTSDAQITLETTVTGVLKGNGTAIEEAAAGTDYLSPDGSGADLTGITASQVGAVATSAVGADSGVASLDDTGNVPLDQLGNVPGGGGSGTVTSVAVETANGLTGTVADDTTTPLITLALDDVTGVLKGTGDGIGAATAGTDYLAPDGDGSELTGITASQTGALPSSGGELTGDVTQEGTGQYAANAADGPVMRLGQKANGEAVWSWNVDQNNGDAIDDPSLPAWKFSLEGGPDYNGAEFQSSPEGGTWDGSSVFSLDEDGNVVISGELTADGGIASAGQPDGLATLDGTGSVPPGQLGNVAAAQGAIGTLTTSNSSEQTLDITQDAYAVVTWGQAQSAQGVTLSAGDGTVTVLTAGAYAFDLSLLVKRTGTGQELAFGFFLNGAQVTEVVGGYGLTAENTQYRQSGSFSAILDVSDVVTVQATLTDADGTLVVTDGQLTVTAGFSGETTVTLDDNASDIQPLGTQAAGSTGMASDAGHVHPSAGVLLAAENLSDLDSAPDARANLGLGTAATEASSAFDAAGAAATAQSSAESYAADNFVPLSDLPLSIADGGTGETAQQAAVNALTGSQSAGKYLRSDGTNASLSAIEAADLPAATTSAQGAVQLAGDLGGTGASPEVVAIQGTAIDAPPGGTTEFLRGDGSWDVPAGSGEGTVTSVAVESANGLAGTVADDTSTPAITLSTTVTGVLKGDGTAISEATAGTDYLAPDGDGSALTGITASQVSAVATSAVGAESGVASLDDTGNVPLDQLGNVPAGGTVTSVSVATANGFRGTVADDTTTPAITIELDILSGVLKGSSTTIEAAEPGTDYLAPDGSAADLTDFPVLNQDTTGTAAGLSETLAIGSGGTGQTSAEDAYGALSPMTTKGDIEYEDATPEAARLAIGSAGDVLTVADGLPAWSALPVASTSAAGIVELAGDLGGTDTDPEVLSTHLSDPLPLAQGGTGVDADSDASLLSSLGAAPLASPALTGTPTAPTASALTDSAQVATTAYADAAVAVETSRAQAAEALLAPLASPAFTGSPTAPTKAALTDSTDIATTAYADAAVAVETSRAETAEALALPKAGGTMSGAIAMGSSKITGLANGSASADAAAFGQLPSSDSPLALTEGGTGESESTAAALLAALGAAALAGATFTGYLAPAVVTLSESDSAVAVNAALGNAFDLTLTSSAWAISTPSNPADGQKITFRITQGTGGSFTVGWAAGYSFGSGSAPVLSTSAGDVDIVGFEYVESITTWCALGSALGFAA